MTTQIISEHNNSLSDFISDSTCLICDYECETKSEIVKHVQTKHLEIISQKKISADLPIEKVCEKKKPPHICPHCGYTSKI